MFRRTKDGRQQQFSGDPLALPRDPATDRSNETDWAALGLDGQPVRPSLGGQTATDPGRAFTRTGMPGLWRDEPVLVQGRDLDWLPLPAISPGQVRRNIRLPQDGIPVPGFFSWAANEQCAPAGRSQAATEPSRVDEYLLTERTLQLPDSAPWVVAGYERPQPGLEGFQSPPGVQGQPGTGWPVLAPEIPSYGSRVPLRRPRGLVTV